MATGPKRKTSVDALACPPSKDRQIIWDSGHREAVRWFSIAALPGMAASATSPAIARMAARRGRGLACLVEAELPPKPWRQAKIILGLVEKGSDPIEERRKGVTKTVRTFRQVAEEWLSLHVEPKPEGSLKEEEPRTSTGPAFPDARLQTDSGCRARGPLTQLHPRMHDKPYQVDRTVEPIPVVWN